MNPLEYESPFTTRYASAEMSSQFSQHKRAYLYRKLWLSLAASQKKLGLNISQQQLDEIEKHLETISFEKVHEYEVRFRHDIMAHIHAFGDQCPSAKPILHLGATSTYVTDNADLIQMKDALEILIKKIAVAIKSLSSFAKKYADTPCLGYTHYQPAQPVTIGKRACLWLQDLLMDALEWERLVKGLPFLGAKGATGTQASFLFLFDNDEKKVLQLEQMIANDFGFQEIVPICGQTYPRKIDVQVLHSLSSFAAGAHKMATDLRLLAHDEEMFEIRGKEQVGSSAMPYKRNPILSERISALSRFLISLDQNATYTLSVQWLERTLDDSANRRFSIPEAFLAADSILNLLIFQIEHLKPDPEKSLQHLQKHLPFLAMENILMSAVKKGKSRQELHEKLRLMSLNQELTAEKISEDPAFGLSAEEVKQELDLQRMIGRAPQQVQEFIEGPIASFLQRLGDLNISLPSLEI